jgi:hypothetical protein
VFERREGEGPGPGPDLVRPFGFGGRGDPGVFAGVVVGAGGIAAQEGGVGFERGEGGGEGPAEAVGF